MEFKNKTVLITGASGLVGVPTVEKCVDNGAKIVYAVDLHISPMLQELSDKHDNVELITTDLTYLHNCESLFAGTEIDIVLHIAGIKGSPKRASSSPADYLFPMLMFNTNMIKASFDANVEWFVYLSSVGVYNPSDLMKEDDIRDTMPSPNDWYPGWAKRMGEAAIESLQIQYGWNKWSIIRPANIYGVNDKFTADATVIGSTMWKLTNVDGDIVAWGDGSPKRDFVFADDVAQATIDVVIKEVNDVINFGCGQAVSIKDTIETIVECYQQHTGIQKKVVWDTTQPNGDMMRQLCTIKQQKYGIVPKTSLREGINKIMVAKYE